MLGKIKELERDKTADLIIVDAPPAGHAAPFLRSASGLSDVVKSGPVLDQAREVSEMLADPARCMALLVALPEETPITEMIELANELGDDLGISLLPLVVNACWPDRPGLDKSPAMAARSHKIKLSASAQVLARVCCGVRPGPPGPTAPADRATRDLLRTEPIITLPRLATPRLDCRRSRCFIADALASAVPIGAAQ